MDISLHGRTMHFGTSAMDITRDVPAVVFLHGAGMDHTVWQLQSRYVAHHGYRSIAVDLPGHGGSEGPALGSIEELAAWTAGLTAELDLGPAHVVGHSMGAMIALRLAADSPDAVQSLVLLGAGEQMAVNDTLLDAAANDQPLAARLMTSWSHDAPTKVGGHDVPGYWQFANAAHLIERCPAGSLHIDLTACNAAGDITPVAAKVTQPTTVVIGAADKMARADSSRRLADAIPNSRVEVIEDAGHMAMIEQSAEFRRLLMSALNN